MIKKMEKLKLMEYIQIYENNDQLLLNLVNKYVLSDLLKLEMVWTSEFHKVFSSILLVHEQRMLYLRRSWYTI